MMTNLFSMFDPSSSFMQLNWYILITSVIFMKILLVTSKKTNLILLLISTIKKETSPILNNKNFKYTEILMISLFTCILILNLISMIPFNFTVNAHMMLTLPIALTWWLSMMMFGWLKQSKTMIMHAVPTGTPIPLINFMIMIEMISNLIRPLTLSIRLSANMIAGHLLMNLLGSIPLTPLTCMLNILAMSTLSTLELAVCCIQAYVFMMLLTLYSTEMN